MKTIIIGLTLFSGLLTLTYWETSKAPAEYIFDNPVVPGGRQLASSEIVFNYSYKGKPLKLTFRNTSWEDSLKHGAEKCMDYYTDGKRTEVGEEVWLDLIDVCVNPREKKS